MKLKQTTLILIAVLVVACAAPTPTPILSPTSPLPSPLASPVLTSTAAPASSAVPLMFDRPIVAGTNIIRGTGPANVPIWIADVTFMGEVLGQGRIGPDSKFAINVKPLEAGHRLGVALAELAGTPWKAEDFYHAEFYGPEEMQIPQVGFFFDTALVAAK